VANQFGNKIKSLRAQKKMLQRHLAGLLDIDPPLLSKIERGERKARKEQVASFSKVLGTNFDDLMTIWLADQVVEIVKDQKDPFKIIQVAEQQLNPKAR
jgi:HTH-type transcriptional regulator, competence development regulator